MPRTRARGPVSDVAEPPAVLREYAEKWVAWSPDRMRFITLADTLDDVLAAAKAAGEADPLVEWVPSLTRQA
jgi:hypothetical protein